MTPIFYEHNLRLPRHGSVQPLQQLWVFEAKPAMHLAAIRKVDEGRQVLPSGSTKKVPVVSTPETSGLKVIVRSSCRITCVNTS